MKTINEQIIEKQEELIQNFKDWCRIKSIHDEDTAKEIAKEAVKLESELSALKQQAEQESNNRLQSESSANNLKTAEEILKDEMPENLWTFICSYPVAYKSEEKLVEWIIDAMQEYAAQFKAEQEKVTDEDIINYALEYISHKSLKPANKGLIKDALIIGAKAHRDKLITHNK